MQYDKFISLVQNRAQLHSDDAALKATRATLSTLSERLVENEAKDLASQLPSQIQDSLSVSRHAERFGLDEFFERISEREGVDIDSARTHARAVTSVLVEAVSPGEVQDVIAELPEEFRTLFSKEQSSAPQNI